MAQATVLAAGSTTATSSDIVVTTAPVKVGIFRDAGEIGDYTVTVYEDTPGADNALAVLSESNPSVVLAGPGTYRVVRPSNSFGINIGVYTE